MAGSAAGRPCPRRDPTASEFRPARFTRFVAVSGRDGQLPPIETTSASEAEPTAAARAGQAVNRLLLGPPLDVSAIAMERMRKLVALPVLSADALSSVAYGPEAMLAVLVLAGLPGLSYSLPVGAAIVFLMLAVGVSYRQTIRAYPQGGGSYIVATQNLGRVPDLARRRVRSCASATGSPSVTASWCCRSVSAVIYVCLQRQHRDAAAAVRGRGVPGLHLVPDRHGGALATPS